MKILAVDDDPEILEVLQAALLSHGYENVFLSATGQQGLDALQSSKARFDCIFLDIMMDGLDGIELCRRIRKISGYDATPIIMLTGKRDKTSIDAAFLAGATDYVTKPFDIVELGARVRVANALVDAQSAIVAAQAGGQQTEPYFVADFEEIYHVGGPDNVIEFDALENYVRQLRSSKIQTANIFGVRLVGLEEVFRRLGLARYVEILDRISEILSSTFSQNGDCFISYAGQGTFAVVLHSEDQVDDVRLEFAVQQEIDSDRNAQSNLAGHGRLDVIVGAPLTSLSGKTNLSGRILRVAVARAQTRVTTKSRYSTSWQRILQA